MLGSTIEVGSVVLLTIQRLNQGSGDRVTLNLPATIIQVHSDPELRAGNCPAVTVSFLHFDRKHLLNSADWRNAFDRRLVKYRDHPEAAQDLAWYGPFDELEQLIAQCVSWKRTAEDLARQLNAISDAETTRPEATPAADFGNQSV
jgi:hypothetical protein